MHNTRNDLLLSTRESICQLLNSMLAELIDLQLQAKQAHWNVKGPNFIALHNLFDEVADAVGELGDTTAERITALGGTALGIVQTVVKTSALPAYPLDAISGNDHGTALTRSLGDLGKRARENIDKATVLGDAGTADLFTEVSRSLDKNLWFVESSLVQ